MFVTNTTLKQTIDKSFIFVASLFCKIIVTNKMISDKIVPPSINHSANGTKEHIYRKILIANINLSVLFF